MVGWPRRGYYCRWGRLLVRARTTRFRRWLSSGADYTVALGGTLAITGYDTIVNTCEADIEGIVSITENDDWDGWDIEGIGDGTVTITIYEEGDEIETFTVQVGVSVSEGRPSKGPAALRLYRGA